MCRDMAGVLGIIAPYETLAPLDGCENLPGYACCDGCSPVQM
jgi:hypothetical protein